MDMDWKAEGITKADEDALFQTLITTAVDGIMVIDEVGNVRVYNRACEGLFGYAPDEVIGRNVKMLMPEPYRAEHDSYIERYKNTGERRIIGIGREVVGRRKDGSTFPMYLSVGEGNVGGERIFVGIIHDVSDVKANVLRIQQLQNELFHSLRLNAMSQLSSALAHELNQPLAAVMNYMNAAKRSLDMGAPPDRLREMLDKAASQTARAGQIIRRMRDFIEKKEPDRRPEDLNGVVSEAIALGLVDAADSDVDVKVELAPAIPPIRIDRVQIQQVMVNLMRNAVEAVQQCEQRELRVSTRLDGDFVAIGVSDTGPGLPEEIAARLFEPFVSTKSQGLGMGLAICRTIVEAHGGRLWAEPNRSGGTAFRFVLPVSEEAHPHD
jgi:two-component system, LuxR family, sensor kinase FixL